MGLLDPLEPTGHRDGVFGLLRRGDGVLLASNPRTVGGRRRPVWDLPGGAVKAEESLVQALRREWREETGLEAEVRDLLLVTDGAKRRAPEAGPIYTWRSFVFVVHAEGEPQPGEGIDALEVVAVEEAIRRLDAPYHEPLRVLLAGGTAHYRRATWIDPVPATGATATAADGEARRRLLVIAAAAAAGHVGLVQRETEAAREAGEDARRIEEVLLQIAPYAGFPRTIAAFGAARAVLGPAPAASDDVPDDGDEAFAQVYGDTAGRVRAGLEALHPTLAAWTRDFAYGRVLARPTLSPLDRELLAVAILTALGGLADPLLGHMRAARRLGASAEDVAAAVAVVPPDVGEARRDAARALLDRLDT